MLIATGQISSSPVAVVIVLAVLFGVSRPIIRWVADREGNPWLIRILTISFVLHMLAAPAQIFVVHHFYHGVADWIRYDTQGKILAPNFRSFNFTLAGSDVRGIVNDGSVSIAAGIVMAIVGINQMATFLVFAWMSWLGTILFYRAFTLTFAGARAGHRRYAYLVFFLPSTIFWTADVSKEAIMTISLGFVALGTARLLVRASNGYRLLIVGALLGAMIRPNELLVVVAALVVALMIRPAADGQRYNGLTRASSILFGVLLLFASIWFTLHYLRIGAGGISSTTAANSIYGGSGGVNYSSDPLRWPIDAYTVLFDPLPINAHGSGEEVAAIENLVIVGIFIASWRQLKILPRAVFARPYVMLCLVYSILFIYAFAALGNLGLIYRERVMLLPFLMVLLAIPRTPKGQPPIYEWEYRRKDRKGFRAMMIQRDRMVRSIRMAKAAGLTAPNTAGLPPVPVPSTDGPPSDLDSSPSTGGSP